MSSEKNAGTTAAAGPPAPARMVSVDALRGFDMFWIIGAEGLVEALNEARGGEGGLIGFIATQLSHAEWVGFRFYDLIFPLFLFIVGVSVVLSMDRIIERDGKWGAHKRIIRRGLLLWLLNIFYYGGIGAWPEPGIRFVGVLARLAFGYVVGAILYCNLRLRGLVIAFSVILIGYWALLTFIPAGVPGHMPEGGLARASYEPGQNLAHYIDYYCLPGRRWNGDWDPEGLLSSIPAVGTCLLGILAGMLLKTPALKPERKVLCLIGGGAAMVLLGYLWGLQFPVIKKIWTSSYVLVAGGYSCVLLGLFYWAIDVLEYRRWALPFIWIGSNALTIYLAVNLIDFGGIAERLAGGPLREVLGPYGDLCVALVALALAVLLTRWMYNRKLFIKV